jgi:hypothetical protein
MLEKVAQPKKVLIWYGIVIYWLIAIDYNFSILYQMLEA